ncbi:MAG: ABC transporter ATP-binding protein [Lachnospiraceae bacterium]|nr:ABC transporter ATP-binding protein [Lachnospiraceae bacterium]MCR4685333.1 ATP-binding cassette domain-containing protein [Lachnospiraceae bacterium]
MENVLEIRHLNAFYKRNQVLQDINLSVGKGEIVGLVGESGCGKSTLAKSIVQIGPRTEGEIVRNGKVQMIFQDPYHSLNPSMTIGRILKEPLIIDRIGDNREMNERVLTMMEKVGLPDTLINRLPSELSGGQRQRVCIGTALMQSPKLIIADEPVSALDVTIQAKVLKLLQKLNREEGIAFLFISHDLRVVYELCSRILIMKDGRIVEQGTDRQIFEDPQEAYTKRLLSAML